MRLSQTREAQPIFDQKNACFMSFARYRRSFFNYLEYSEGR